MKLLLDDKTTRGYDLNANEACIFAAILKCTRAGRGWYGNYRELAAAMPFVMSHMTAHRAIEKLLNLGLLERRENKLFALYQNVTESSHNVTTLEQNVTDLEQIVLPPNNPLNINNNMKEKEKEQPRALCTHDGEKQPEDLFEMFWKFFNPAPEYHNRLGATKFAFLRRSDVAQQAIVQAAQDGVHQQPNPQDNPYFFVQDFPEPLPQFLSGVEQDKCHADAIPLVQVRYNGKFLICTRDTATTFNLEIVRPW